MSIYIDCFARKDYEEACLKQTLVSSEDQIMDCDFTVPEGG